MLWSPDGRSLAAQTSLGIYLYRPSTPYEPTTDASFVLAGNEFGRVVFSPDSKWLIYALSEAVQLFDVTDGKPVSTIPAQPGFGAMITFNATGTILVTNTVGEDCICDIDLWDIRDLPKAPHHLMTLKAVEVSSFGIRDSAFSPDETQLASIDSDGRVRIWDLNTGQQIAVLKSQGAFTDGHVAFSADGTRLVTTSSYPGFGPFTSVYIWDLEKLPSVESTSDDSGALIEQYTQMNENSLALSHDGSTLSLSLDSNHILFVDLQTGQEITRIPSSSAVYLGFSEDDVKLFAVDRDQNIWIWNVEDAMNYSLNGRQALTVEIVKTASEAQKYIPTFHLPAWLLNPKSLGLGDFQSEIRTRS